MLRYAELIEKSKSLNLGFHLEKVKKDVEDFNNSLRMSNHLYPWSLKFEEATILYNLIYLNNLKTGFEIATGFGVSSLCIGQALRFTGGKLVSMDAYVEELLGYNHYNKDTNQTKKNSDGYIIATKMAEAIKVDENIEFRIGWSPVDTHKIITSVHGSKPLDFVFIDGGHSSEQILLDVVSVISRLEKENALIMFHDHGTVCNTSKQIIKDFGFTKFKDYKTEFSFVVYAKGNIKI